MVKNLSANAGDRRDADSSPGWDRCPGVANAFPPPNPVFLPGKFHRQRSLIGYSPWGHRESNTTKHTHTHTHTHIY